MRKLLSLLTLLLSFNAYAVDPLIEPTSVINCEWPTEREDDTPFPVSERGGINFYHSVIPGVYDKANPNATSATLCQFTVDNTVLADGNHYFIFTVFDTESRTSDDSPEKVHVVKRVTPPKAGVWVD
jgi:hypothetical protein